MCESQEFSGKLQVKWLGNLITLFWCCCCLFLKRIHMNDDEISVGKTLGIQILSFRDLE